METKFNDILISVIVPVYGVEDYIEKCIQSLLSQTYRNLQIILVNDGSEDSCPSICDKYKDIDDRILVIHKQNGGLVSARKAGLLKAEGEYIGFVDGDDWVEPQMFEDMVKYVYEYKVDIVACGYMEELGDKIVEVLYNNIPCGLYLKDALVSEVYPKMLYHGKFSQFGIFSFLWNKLFKREIIFKNQMKVDEQIFMAEDAACTYPALLDANSLYISDSTFYRYRQRVDSMVKSREINSNELIRYNILYNYLYDCFQSTIFVNELLPQLDYFLLSLITVRSGLKFKDDSSLNDLYTFGEIPDNSNLVVCGAGTFGQHLVKRIKVSSHFKFVGWIDNLFANYNAQGLSVDPLLQINNIDYDFILIAFIDEVNAENMKNKLITYGVPSEKILKVSHYFRFPIRELLKRFGILRNK